MKRDRRRRESVGMRNGLFLMMSGGSTGQEVERVTEMLISHLEAEYKNMRNKNPSECRSSKKNGHMFNYMILKMRFEHESGINNITTREERGGCMRKELPRRFHSFPS